VKAYKEAPIKNMATFTGNYDEKEGVKGFALGLKTNYSLGTTTIGG